MIAILEIRNNEPVAWMVATDMDDARRQAQGAGRMDLAQSFYTMTPPMETKTEIAPGVWLLRM